MRPSNFSEASVSHVRARPRLRRRLRVQRVASTATADEKLQPEIA